MARVYFCLDDIMLLKQMMDMAMEEQDMKIVGITTTMLDGVEELLVHDAEVLVLRHAIDRQGAQRLLEDIAIREELENLQVISIFDEMDAAVFALMAQYDLDTFVAKPYTAKELHEAIRSKSQQRKQMDNGNWTLENIAGRILMELGLPSHLLGFSYLRTAAILYASQRDPLHLKMGNLYAMVAKQHGTTLIRVEKCMRTSIQYAYRHCPEAICIYNAKPTSSQIIHYVSERLKLNMMSF